MERLRDLIGLIERVQDRTTAVEILESLLRYYVQGTQRVDEHDVRHLLQQTTTAEPLMQTFIDRDMSREDRREDRKEKPSSYCV